MKYSQDEMVQREHHYSIVDEIDSCLIDEARTPLVISGAAEDKTNQYLAIDKLVRQLNSDDYEIDEKDKNILLTNKGITNIEKIFSDAGILKNNNFYDPENLNLVHHVNQALRANHLFEKGKDYIVKDESLKILSLIEGEEHRFELNTKAIHFAHNALGALITAKTLDCDIVKACESLKAWLPGVGRGSIKKINLGKIGSIELIDDGYNANPASISAALNTLGKNKAKRRIAILGDMKELGAAEIDYHKEIASLDVISKLDCIHTVGPLMKFLHDILPEEKRGFHFKKSIDVVPLLDTILKGGDCLLIKASLSVGMKVIADAISDLEFTV